MIIPLKVVKISLRWSQDAVESLYVSGSDMCVQRPLGGLKKPSGGCSLGPVKELNDTGSASIQAVMILMLKAALEVAMMSLYLSQDAVGNFHV